MAASYSFVSSWDRGTATYRLLLLYGIPNLLVHLDFFHGDVVLGVDGNDTVLPCSSAKCTASLARRIRPALISHISSLNLVQCNVTQRKILPISLPTQLTHAIQKIHFTVECLLHSLVNPIPCLTPRPRKGDQPHLISSHPFGLSPRLPSLPSFSSSSLVPPTSGVAVRGSRLDVVRQKRKKNALEKRKR